MSERERADDVPRVLDWRGGLSTGDAAQLRRCRTVGEVRMHPAFVRLVWSMRGDGRSVREEDLAIAASLAASLREKSSWAAQEPQDDSKQTRTAWAALKALGRVMSKDDRVADLRFRRLLRLQRQDHDERLSMLRRLLHLIGQEAARRSVAEGLLQLALCWDDHTKRELATAYYQPESSSNLEPVLEA